MIRLMALAVIAFAILSGCASVQVREQDGYIGPPRDERGELIQPPTY